MYGLNDEPTWRNACVARLNFDCSKLRPPTIAFTSPVELSSASKRSLHAGLLLERDPALRAVQLHDLHVHQVAARQELLTARCSAST